MKTLKTSNITQILGLNDDLKANNMILQILLKGSQGHYDVFVKALVEIGQEYLAELLKCKPEGDVPSTSAQRSDIASTQAHG
jgi:hypothetical protein